LIENLATRLIGDILRDQHAAPNIVCLNVTDTPTYIGQEFGLSGSIHPLAETPWGTPQIWLVSPDSAELENLQGLVQLIFGLAVLSLVMKLFAFGA
jgi:hypothetical protein